MNQHNPETAARRANRRNALELASPNARENAFLAAARIAAAPAAVANARHQGHGHEHDVPVMVSVRDGKIGSVYFDGHRIRTTHEDGPSYERKRDTTVRLQLDERAAFELFETQHQGLVANYRLLLPAAITEERQRIELQERLGVPYLTWISEHLRTAVNADAGLPDWAVQIASPDDAFPLEDDTETSREEVLFEVDTNPSVAARDCWHVSRGAPRSMQVSNQEVDALEAAILAAVQEHTVRRRNDVFYNTLGTRAPRIAAMIERPEEINQSRFGL